MSSTAKRATSLILSFLIGFSSIGYSADLHFCKGDLKSMAFFGTAKSCHEMSAKPSCHHSADEKEETFSCEDGEDKDCCTNQKVSDNFEYDGVSLNEEISSDDDFVLPLKSKWNQWNLSDEEKNTTSINDPPDLNNRSEPYGLELRIAIQSFLC